MPNQQGKLVSASVDGLICTFDIAGDINDDDHLESVSMVFPCRHDIIFQFLKL